MTLRFCCLFVASVLCAFGQHLIPSSPAGRTFQVWLEAFNSGDEGRIRSYVQKYEPGKTAESILRFRHTTGGFDVLEAAQDEPLYLLFRLKERGSETTAVGRIDVDSTGEVLSFALRAVPSGTTLADVQLPVPSRVILDSAARREIIDAALGKLRELYVFPETATTMAAAVRQRLERGEYDRVKSVETFTNLLTEHLREVSHDKHLRINAAPQSGDAPAEGMDAAAAERRQLERTNCGWEKVEWLPGNVGYVKFNTFAPPEQCGVTVAAAMSFLAHADSLIFDLRDNIGGSTDMVARVATYLFSGRTHLNDVWDRRDGSTQESWTRPDIPGPRLADKPVYVLTSRFTGSAAEEFSYDLQRLKRATILGETTAGAAHLVTTHRIHDQVTIIVPYARAINPISKTNWEGQGVQPDVLLAASQALAKARDIAAGKANGQRRD